MRTGKHIGALFILWLMYGSVFSQDPGSLKLAYKNAKHDTVRCRLLNQLVEEAAEDEWYSYNLELKKLAESNIAKRTDEGLRTFYMKYLAISLNNCGFFESEKGEADKALEFYNKAFQINESIKDTVGMIGSLWNIAYYYGDNGMHEKGIQYSQKSLGLLLKTKQKGVTRTYNYIGRLNDDLGKIGEAMKYYEKAVKAGDDSAAIATSYNNIALIHFNQGFISKAIDNYSHSLKIQEGIHDSEGYAKTLSYIGLIYSKQGELEKAEEYTKKSLAILKKVGTNYNIALVWLYLGVIYQEKQDLEKASKCFEESLGLYSSVGDKEGIAKACNNLGVVQSKLNNTSKAFEYHNKALETHIQIKDLNGMAFSYRNIGHLLYDDKQYGKARQYGIKAMEIAEQLGYPELLSSVSGLLSRIYSKENDHKKALEYFEKYILMRDSMANAETKKAAIRSQLKYDYEKQAAQDSVKNAEKIVQESIKHEEAIKQQRLYTYGGGVGFGMMLIIAGISFRAYRNKQKANLIINAQKELVEEQKLLVEEKQKEILDSIRYAKRIQSALLPSEKYVKRSLTKLQKN